MIKSLLGSLLLGTCLLPAMAHAQARFAEPHEFKGRFRVENAAPGLPVTPGSSVTISGMGLQPNQSLVLHQGRQALHDAPVIVDEKGQVSVQITLPQTAHEGLHKLTAFLEGPDMTGSFDLKVSSPFEPMNAQAWQVLEKTDAKGLYQLAYSPVSDALFLTGSDFRGGTSELLKLDPETLEVVARITPADFPEDQKPPKKDGPPKGNAQLAPAGVFGLALDDARGLIWVTNTPDNTIAVYRQSDLSLVKQFPPGTVYHSREALVDPLRNRVFVSSSASSNVYAFDADTLEAIGVIKIASAQRGGDFYVMNLAANPAKAEIYVTSRISNELAVIDASSLEVKRVWALPGAKNATGVAVDTESGRIFVASQDSDNLLILDGDSGAVLHDVKTSAGSVSVTFDAHSQLAWVAGRQGGLTAVDADGQVVAQLEGGSYPNHVVSNGHGVIYAANKSLGADDAKGDFVRRIEAK